jgi:pyruvate dehydrogenase E1 component beta subunit
MPVITYRDALGAAIREEMQRDDRVFLMGEEVGVYNGAYKVSKGFLQEFGEMRVVWASARPWWVFVPSSSS